MDSALSTQVFAAVGVTDKLLTFVLISLYRAFACNQYVVRMATRIAGVSTYEFKKF